MKHLLRREILFSMFLFLSFLCCTEEESTVQQSTEEEIRDFFALNQSESRSGTFSDELLDVIIRTLYQQDHLIDAVRSYKGKYGTPMWEHAISISTPNGFQFYVPIYNKRNKNEIKSIWNFGIYNNKLYHFTDVRNENAQLIEEYWKFDYFTYYALGEEPASGLKFHTESRSVEKCVNVSVTAGEGELASTSYSMVCWEVNEREYIKSALDKSGGSNGGFTSGTDLGDDNNLGMGSGGGSGGAGSGSSSTNTISYETIKEKIKNKLGTNCGISAILERIGGLSGLIGEIMMSKDYTGGYDAKNKKILMANGWDGDVTGKTFVEELIHFMQDQIYAKGIGTLMNTTVTNIEFEAKVLVDIYQIARNEGKFYRVESVVLQGIDEKDITTKEYKDFIYKIEQGDSIDNDYKNMLNKFNSYTPYPEYKNKMDTTLNPALLNSCGENMFLNNCNYTGGI